MFQGDFMFEFAPIFIGAIFIIVYIWYFVHHYKRNHTVE
ncbi:hypothetical protein J2Y67_000223 [Neobacillus niacini]|nr:hypothetical protein [Neobacillus niacini]